MRNVATIFFLSIGLFLLSAPAAFACSCAESPTVDREFAWAKNVAVMKLNSVNKGPTGYIVSSVLSIEKVFKGNLKAGAEHFLAQGSGADCIWTFNEDQIGQDFLFYLADETAIASTCSRSNEISRAAADIKYLEKIGEVRRRTRISGMVRKYDRAVLEGQEGRLVALDEHPIRIIGAGRDLRIKTDENGVYEVYGLPPGQYRIEPEKINGYRVTKGYSSRTAVSTTVNLLSQSHAEANFTFEVYNSISGRVIDHEGKPLEGVKLGLLPASGIPYRYFTEIERSGPGGSFRFENVPPGTYVIVGNEKNEITPEDPYPKFYSSGSADRSTATEITIGPGQFLDGFTVKASRPAQVVTISGRIVYEDGSPALNSTVKFLADRPSVADSWDAVDNSGNFQMKMLKGQKGVIFGYIVASTFMFPGCETRIEAAKKKAASVRDDSIIETRPVPFVATSDLTGVEIKFPFTLCPRKR